MTSTAARRLHDLFMELIRTTGLLQVDQTIPGHPISVSQAFALHELDTDVPLSQRDLAERLRLEKSSVSRMVADMEHKGLVARERDPRNRRLYRLRLTEEGRALHRGMVSAFDKQFERWVAVMSRTERDALLHGLPALLRAMRQEPA